MLSRRVCFCFPQRSLGRVYGESEGFEDDDADGSCRVLLMKRGVTVLLPPIRMWAKESSRTWVLGSEPLGQNNFAWLFPDG